MRFLTDNRGQIRVIEAFFAAVLLLSALAMIPSETHVGGSNDEILHSAAQRTLITLDSDGTLSRLIENGRWTTLRQCVQSLLSPAIWFNLTIFDENMNPINEVQISNGSQINKDTVAADYVCASSGSNYRIYVIRLQLSNVN
jgi:hypothetical protein